MGRIIIENRSDLTDEAATKIISKIIGQGRISNDGKQYCYETRVIVEDDEYMVWGTLIKRSDRFVIEKQYKL